MEFPERVAGVASLSDPVRRQLYRFVVTQAGAVSRDAASEGVGVPRHTAKFHLDRLVEDGLLVAEYQRLTSRRGPGAGRPAKLYRRSDQEVAVSLPERRYDLAGALMADAIETSVSEAVPVTEALSDAAARLGERLAQGEDLPASSPGADRLTEVLSAHGYEPRRRGSDVELANCPFHRLARDHTELVCGMNLALLRALVGQLAGPSVRAELDPGPDRCCVVLRTGSRAGEGGC